MYRSTKYKREIQCEIKAIQNKISIINHHLSNIFSTECGSCLHYNVLWQSLCHCLWMNSGNSVFPEVCPQAHLKTNVLLTEKSFPPHCLNTGVDSGENGDCYCCCRHRCLPCPCTGSFKYESCSLLNTLRQDLSTLQQLSAIIWALSPSPAPRPNTHTVLYTLPV